MKHFLTVFAQVFGALLAATLIVAAGTTGVVLVFNAFFFDSLTLQSILDNAARLVIGLGLLTLDVFAATWLFYKVNP